MDPAVTADEPSGVTAPVAAPVGAAACTRSRFGTFAECPHCGGALAPEHAHFKCRACGWRDSCCD